MVDHFAYLGPVMSRGGNVTNDGIAKASRAFGSLRGSSQYNFNQESSIQGHSIGSVNVWSRDMDSKS